MGWMGTGAALFLFLTPMGTCRKIIREGTTGDFSDISCVVTLLNCSLWVAYANVTPDRFTCFVTNASGFVLQSGYLVCFLRYHSKESRALLLKKIAAVALLFLVLFGGSMYLGKVGSGDSESSEVLGIVCDVINALMYAAPLSVMLDVIRTKSVKSMPLPLSIGCEFCSFMWAFYALWVGDIYIGLPNNAGVVLGICQLSIYARYRKGSSDQARGSLLAGGHSTGVDAEAGGASLANPKPGEHAVERASAAGA